MMKTLLGARLSGAYKDNPFFLPDSGRPIRDPYVLSEAEWKRAYRIAD